MAIKRRIKDIENRTPLSVFSFDANGFPTTILQSDLISGGVSLTLESSTIIGNIGVNQLLGNTDGINTVFTVPELQYVSGEIRVFVESIELTLNEQWEETDSTAGIITLADPPQPGVQITVKYNSTQEIPPPFNDVFVSFGSGATPPLNFNPIQTVFTANSNRGELLNVLQEPTGIELTINLPNGFANNVANNGVNFGSTSFDDSLINIPVYRSCITATTARPVEYILSGFDANEIVNFSFCAIRTTNGSGRQTQVQSNNGLTLTFDIDSNPPENPKEMVGVQADATGNITFTQTVVNTEDISALSGLQFSIQNKN